MAFTITPDTLPILPDDIAYGYPGGPEYLTDTTVVENRQEERNGYWPEPVYSWDLGYLVKTPEQLSRLIRFHHACKGRWLPFRLKDWEDYKSCDLHETPAFDDVSLGAAAAGQTEFQLKKIYTESPYETEIEIIKPKGDTILIGEDGVPVTSGWTIDESTGLITRATPLAGGEVITWGGEFYRKARFDLDKLNINMEAFEAGSIEVPVIGLR